MTTTEPVPAPTGIPIDQIIAGFALAGVTGPESVVIARNVLDGLRQYGLDPDANRIEADRLRAENEFLRLRVESYEATLGDARHGEAGWRAQAERQKARADAHEASTRLLEHMSQPHIAMVPPDLGNMLAQIKAAREVDPLPDESNG